MSKATPNLDRRKLYYVRSSYLTQAKHSNDYFTNFGYDYRGNLLKNTTSPELWANPLQIPLYGKLEGLIVFVLEQVKIIKKHFAISIDKNNLNVN